MSKVLDFGGARVVQAQYATAPKHTPIDFAEVVVSIFKLALGIFFIISAILNMWRLYKMYQLYSVRQKELMDAYVLLVKKKNQFDYVSSAAYRLEQMRRLYGAFAPGEREVIILGQIAYPDQSSKTRDVSYWQVWKNFLIYGVSGVESKK